MVKWLVKELDKLQDSKFSRTHQIEVARQPNSLKLKESQACPRKDGGIQGVSFGEDHERKAGSLKVSEKKSAKTLEDC